MVKFSKQMELQLVPEWRHKFCDYWQLKKYIKKIKMQRLPESPRVMMQEAAAGKKLAAMEGTWTPLSSFTRRTMHPWCQEDMIKVHQRKSAGEESVYETELLEPLAQDELERAFFKRLDEELNKVNHFFCSKEQEFLERAEMLSRQLASLTDIRKAYEITHSANLDTNATTIFSSPSTPRLFGFLLGTSTRAISSLSSCGQTYQAGGMESEENSTYPLTQHGLKPARNLSIASESDDNSERPLFARASHVIVSIADHDNINSTVEAAAAGDVDIITQTIIRGNDDDDYDDDDKINNYDMYNEEGAAQDGLFYKKSTAKAMVMGGCCCAAIANNINIAAPNECKCEGNLFSSSAPAPPHDHASLPASSTISQRLWDYKNQIRDCFNYSFMSRSKIRGSSLRSESTNIMNRTISRNLSSIDGDQLNAENWVSMRKIKHARKMLRTAFVEFYRGLGLLRTFSSLNMLAFAKILKKYDKVTGRQASLPYMKVVENAHFSTSDKVIKMMDEVETLFTEHFAKDDEKKAMMLLRPVQNEAPHTITFFLGLFSGSSLALLMAFAIMLHLYIKIHSSKANEKNYLQATYQVFGMLFLVLLHMYIYGWNVYAWRKTRINYAFIFEFAPKTELRHREVLLVCTGLTTMILGGMLGHLAAYISSTRSQINSDMVPLITIVALLLLLVCPLNVCYRSSRVYFLGCMKRVVLSPFYKVLLADFFLADQLTSQVASLRSLQFVMCYYFGGFFQSHDTAACGSNEFRFLAYLISFLPYWWRLMQCIRRWVEEGDQSHLANGGKYLSAMVAAAARISYSYYATPGWLVVFVITSSFATLYQMYWDIVRDWGFFQPNSHNPWLRDQLVLKNKSTYYFSIALNFILRFAWLQQVTHWQIKNIEHNGTDLFFAALEVIRRGHWNFYRLENEHLNNVGKYRAIKSVPLPFRDGYANHT